MQYDFTLGAGQAQVLEVSGTYFTYKGGTGPIRVTASTGGYVDLLPGQGMTDIKFDRLTIKDMSGAGNIGVILAGEGAWRDERITGSVEVIDGGRNRTLANQAFMGRGYTATVAGSTPELHLWNPVGSGVRLVVERVTRATNTAGTVHIPITSVQPATFLSKAQSKLSGGAQGKAELRQGYTVGQQVITTVLTSDSVTPGTPLILQFIEPVVIMPGYGLYVAATTQGADVAGTFEFFEDPLQ